MFEEIENFYRKECINNKLNRKIIITYAILYTLVCISGLFKYIITIPLFMIGCIFCIKKVCEKELNSKLKLSIQKKDTKSMNLKNISKEKDKLLLKKYLKQKRYYSEETLKYLMEHYRALSVSRTSNNFIATLSIVVSILIPFLNVDNGSPNSKICFTIFMLIFFIIYWLYKKFTLIIKTFTGENNMYTNLEEIFTTLIIEKSFEAKKKKKKIKTN